MKIFVVNNHSFCSTKRLSTQGPEDELPVLTVRRFYGDFRSGTLRPVVKECSETFARKHKVCGDELL